MTDEEKAEEYVKEQILKHNRDVVLRPKNAVTYIDELKEAVMYGLAEGRKEKCLEQNNDGTIRPCEVMKENKELKKQTEKIIEIDTAKIFELTTELNELKAQVAKQRCKNAYVASDKNSAAVPCYTVYNCKNCPRRS